MALKNKNKLITDLKSLPGLSFFGIGSGKGKSVQTKIFLALFVIFLLILSSSITYTFISQRQLAYDMMVRQTEMTAHFYVDNINLLMVNDEMDDRDIVQNKMMQQPGILEARIIRAPIINETYGDGFPDQSPVDEYDRRALEGESITWIKEDENGRNINMILPIPALSIYRGTKCLGCHEEIKPEEEGKILGATRVSYSLKAYDEQIAGNLVNSVIIMLSLFAFGFLVLALLFNNMLIRPINKLVRVSARIADGDLAQKITVDSQDETGRLMQAMHDMNNQLYEIVGRVRTSSETVSLAASEIANGNNDLAQRTKSQAFSLKDTASSIEELSVTVSQNADNANEVSRLASHTREQAERGGEVVVNAVQAMTEINSASKRIADITGVIDEIAFQTNLLALNAAVEAARAGEEGRGFAVVAGEVRRLAQRCADAAKEISNLIEDSVKKVEGGSRLVDETGDMLHKILESVTEVSNYVTDIATSSREQSAGIENVNRAIIQMELATNQNSQMVQETAAASHSLEQQALELQQTIKFFKVGEQKSAERKPVSLRRLT